MRLLRGFVTFRRIRLALGLLLRLRRRSDHAAYDLVATLGDFIISFHEEHSIMTEDSSPRATKWPSDDEIRGHFTQYAYALGSVVHAWNVLLERMGDLFVIVTGGHRGAMLGVWNVPDSDRVKIEMLRAAIELDNPERWKTFDDNAQNGLIFLCTEATSLIDSRNNAVHSPSVLAIDENSIGMVAHPFSYNKRAKKLRDIDLLLEFDRIERWADGLSYFSRQMESAMHPNGQYPWPNKPNRPSRRTKNDLLILPLPSRKEPPLLPPESSQA